MYTGNKYGAKKAERDGLVFASRKEARRYDELKLLEYAGVISELECQPRYELQPAFKRNGKTERAIVYVGDFAYTEDGTRVVEDVKGGKATRTAAFEIKRKLFLYKFPEIEFRVIG